MTQHSAALDSFLILGLLCQLSLHPRRRLSPARRFLVHQPLPQLLRH